MILALECVAIESRPAVRPRASPHAAARFKPTGREAAGSPEPNADREHTQVDNLCYERPRAS